MAIDYGCHGLFTKDKETDECCVKLKLEDIKVNVTVRGFVASVSAKLNYVNNTKYPLEVTYNCPVDENSAIYHFEATLDGRTIFAQCLEKNKAKKEYVKAVTFGYTAILAEEDNATSDLFHVTLGNLPPGEKCELCLKFVSELPVDCDGGVTFTLPTVFNPRYAPDDCAGPTPATHATTGNIVLTTASTYEISFDAEVIGGSNKIAEVKSFTDSIHVVMEEEDSIAKITLNEAFKRDHDFSFRAHYRCPHQPHLVRERGDRTAVSSFMRNDVMMLNFFPELPSEAQSPHNEIIFLVDRSGSMEGKCIRFAKSSLLLFLKSLPVGCRFNIVSFGSSSEKLFDGSSERYTEKTLKKALKLQISMKADFGGTEILSALKTVYSLKPTKGYARQILVLTDGEVWNVDQVLSLVHQNNKENRVFSLGVGSGASSALVKGMAQAGGGRSEMIQSPDLMQKTVIGLLSSMLQEPVIDLRVDCNVDVSAGENSDQAAVRMVPKVPPVIFGGQHLMLYARIEPHVTVKSIVLSGMVRGMPVKYEVISEIEKIVHDESLSLHRLAAKAQIKQWQMDGPDHRDDTTELSESTSVISRYTAFLGMDRDSKVYIKKKITQPREESRAERCLSIPEYISDNDDDMGCCLFDEYPMPVSKAKLRHRHRKINKSVSRSSVGSGSYGYVQMAEVANCEIGKTSEMEIIQDDILKIADLQKFDGSWTLDDAKVYLDMDDRQWEILQLFQKKHALIDSSLATAIILTLLNKKYAHREQEWRMVAQKAKYLLLMSRIENLDNVLQLIIPLLQFKI